MINLKLLNMLDETEIENVQSSTDTLSLFDRSTTWNVIVPYLQTLWEEKID